MNRMDIFFTQLKNIFQFNKKKGVLDIIDDNVPVKQKVYPNWEQDRYNTITVQRNVLLIILLILLIVIIVSVICIAYLINKQKFDPFVIQIDSTTGISTVVNPTSSDILSGNDALARYFIKKYTIARETYNHVDFDHTAKDTVRLLSSSNVYWQYRGYLLNEQLNPSFIYRQENSTYLQVKSWSKLSNTKYMLRFSIHETVGNRNVFHKIAVISFEYVAIELTEEEMDINPVGFQVTGYRVDDDNS